jgi:glucose-6-phosphate isomerase
VFEALRTDPDAAAASAGRTLRFLANVDPVDVARALTGLDAESTLVVVVSKTFTTAETMLNARTVKKWLLDSVKGADSATIIRQHMAAVRYDCPSLQLIGHSAFVSTICFIT